MYSPDLLAYDRALESFIGLNASTHELSHSEMETRMNKAYTIQVSSLFLACIKSGLSDIFVHRHRLFWFSQFQDFTCIKLKDYRVCVVVSFLLLFSCVVSENPHQCLEYSSSFDHADPTIFFVPLITFP